MPAIINVGDILQTNSSSYKVTAVDEQNDTIDIAHHNYVSRITLSRVISDILAGTTTLISAPPVNQPVKQITEKDIIVSLEYYEQGFPTDIYTIIDVDPATQTCIIDDNTGICTFNTTVKNILNGINAGNTIIKPNIQTPINQPIKQIAEKDIVVGLIFANSKSMSYTITKVYGNMYDAMLINCGLYPQHKLTINGGSLGSLVLALNSGGTTIKYSPVNANLNPVNQPVKHITNKDIVVGLVYCKKISPQYLFEIVSINEPNDTYVYKTNNSNLQAPNVLSSLVKRINNGDCIIISNPVIQQTVQSPVNQAVKQITEKDIHVGDTFAYLTLTGDVITKVDLNKDTFMYKDPTGKFDAGVLSKLVESINSGFYTYTPVKNPVNQPVKQTEKPEVGDFIKNNDGRTTCYSCGAPTKKVTSIFSVFNVCTKCGK